MKKIIRKLMCRIGIHTTILNEDRNYYVCVECYKRFKI